MRTNIGIAKTDRRLITEQLNRLLADEYILYTKTRNAHWNVIGADFHAAHLFFESQYAQLSLMIDEIAERIRALDFTTPGSLNEFLALSSLSELRGIKQTNTVFIVALMEDHEAVIRFIRPLVELFEDTYKDAGTADFMTSLLEKHEKMAWMLRAHLE